MVITSQFTPVEVFCTYAHEDEVWLRNLEKHLSLLQRQGLISLWHDRLISPGTNWAASIDVHLETAAVILLLVSADFLASDYCYGVEMKRALERQEAGEARVVPILIRPVDWTGAPFAHLQALPTDAKPIAFRQDEETALADVAAGIRRVIVEDLPLLAASAPRAALPAIWNIPYPHNPFFLGRDEDLARLRRLLQAGQAMALSQPQAISGLGGIGKTQLALEYAYRYHQDYQAVLWARAESTEDLVSSYVAIALLLQLPEREAKKQEIIVQAVKTWLQTHRSWLLILDNADELALLPDFLPPSLGGHLLLTTRAAATGRLAHRLEIETLLPEVGALFLLRRAGLVAPDISLEQVSSKERELALQISHELGGLPLALDQAGAYLEETGTNLTDYWQIYQQHRDELLRQRGGLVTDHPAPVATTWSLSFQKVEEKNPAAADLLRLCAYLAPDTIPEEILMQGAPVLGLVLSPVAADAFLLSQAIEALRAYSLMQRNPISKTLSIHRLLQVILRDAMVPEEAKQWMERAVRAVNATFPTAEFSQWTVCERCLSHVLVCTIWINQLNTFPEAAHLLNRAGDYLMKRARYSEAQPLLERAYQMSEQMLGPEHLETARDAEMLAALYESLGRYAEAELLVKRVLTIREQQLGPEHPDTAATLHHLAAVSWNQGKYAEAEPLFQRALTIAPIVEEQVGVQDPSRALRLHGLALLHFQQGSYAEAERLYRQVLTILEQQVGDEHPDTAIIFYNLAGVYEKQGRYAEAEPLYQKALGTYEQLLGAEHPYTPLILNTLADLYEKQGRYAEAEPLYQQALAKREQHMGPEHLDTAMSLFSLAHLYEKQGKYEQAEPLYQRALHIRKKHLGSEHPRTVEVMHRVALLRDEQGNKEAAFEEEKREKGEQSTHPEK